MALLAEADWVAMWTAVGAIGTLALVVIGLLTWLFDRLFVSGKQSGRMEAKIDGIVQRIDQLGQRTHDHANTLHQHGLKISEHGLKISDHESRIGKLEGNRHSGNG